MKIGDILKAFNITIFQNTICIWDSSIDGMEKLCDMKGETIGGIEIYLTENERKEVLG